MIKSFLIPAAALAMIAGSAIASPANSHTDASVGGIAHGVTDWGVVKQQVGFKRRGFRGHRRGFRRGFRGRRFFGGHRFGFRRSYRPYYYGGYHGGFHRGGFGFRGFGVRGTGTVR